MGWDRPVKEERHILMRGPQQEELSSGLQQQDAIWPKKRQLPGINAIPSVPPPASGTTIHSLPLCWTCPLPFPISALTFFSCLVFPSPLQSGLSVPSLQAASLLLSLVWLYSAVPPYRCVHPPPPTSHSPFPSPSPSPSLSLTLPAQSVCECTKHSSIHVCVGVGGSDLTEVFPLWCVWGWQ